MDPSTRNDFPSARWRGTIAALLLAWLVLVAACGPGVGGTGTGTAQDPLPALGAQSASVCAGALAGALSCPVGEVSAVPTPVDGTGVVTLVDSATSPRVLASVSGNLLQLETSCGALRFSGEWGTRPGETARYYGLLTRDAATELATLELTPVDTALQAGLRDAQGHLVLGPLLLQRVGPMSAPVCP